MRSARHQLILLGFLCQGLSWDDYFLPLVYALLWALCLRGPRPRVGLGPKAEGFLLLAGCAAAYLFGHLLGRSTHFFIGHGLVLVQAVRLIRPLTRRDKIVSLFIAVFHVGVACTFLFDLRFVPVLLLAFFLIPKALVELEAESFSDLTPALPGAAPGGLRPSRQPRLRVPFACSVLIALVMVAFFLFFPRVLLRTPLATSLSGAANQGTVLDSVLDPARSGLAQSSQVLFHIEGENLGYMRCFSLTDFDGTKWSRPPRAPLRPIPYAPWDQLARYSHRHVRVKNALFLARVLPTDGTLVFLFGKFFGRPFQNAHGGIEADAMWNTANNVYDYWIDPVPNPAPLLPAQVKAYTQYPQASPRLQAWLDQVLTGATNSYAQARKLEAYLRDRFTYELGTPELNRLNPLEDFLFRERRGHCERFAAALTSLLRLKGIPSRIVVGYVPTSRNPFSGGYNVRFKDAHAWTEAFFPDRGWVQLDATPRATTPPEDWPLRDLMADLDYAWSSYVVNFDAPAQSQLLATSILALTLTPGWVRQNWLPLLPIAAVAVLGIVWRVLRPRWPTRRVVPPARQQTIELAEHYYGQMLRALARLGRHRQPHQTPYEFLSELAQRPTPCLPEVRLVTGLFCAARYGNCTLTAEQRAAIEQALTRIRQANGR